MGIYPDTYYEKQPDGSLFVRVHTPGLDVITVYPPPIVVIENRTDCYCCSCGDSSADPHCRNHGWVGERPCEEHNMPGKHVHPEDMGLKGEPYMPESVQQVRRDFDG